MRCAGCAKASLTSGSIPSRWPRRSAAARARRRVEPLEQPARLQDRIRPNNPRARNFRSAVLAPEALRIADRESQPDSLDSLETRDSRIRRDSAAGDQGDQPRGLDRCPAWISLRSPATIAIARPETLRHCRAVADLGQVEHEPGGDLRRVLVAEAETLARATPSVSRTTPRTQAGRASPCTRPGRRASMSEHRE